MRDKLKNKAWQEGVLVGLYGLALGVYSMIGFFTAPVQTAWFLSPYLFPLLIAVLALPLALALIREGRRAEAGEGEARPAGDRKRLLAVILTSLAYAALLPLLHFIPATLLFLAALLFLLGERRKWMIAAVAVLSPLLLYALFSLALKLRLP